MFLDVQPGSRLTSKSRRKPVSRLFMFRTPATGWVGVALIAFSCFGLGCLALAQGPLPEERELRTAPEDIVIHVNQVAYDQTAPKFAVLETRKRLPESSRFRAKDALTLDTVFEGTLAGAQECEEWFPGRFFYRADFSSLQRPGRFTLAIERDGKEYHLP
ncbi:MAG TPA: cellulase N-terminal Ig-like domain-containing protein, partial [Candidatus Saccharimonadales bacterium]|nr:cellulase N-terminal Ig-like domain-containing protein [Candidatus Saccharimonadales bacterium]